MGTTASNTAVFKTGQPEVKMSTSAASLPYTVLMTETYDAADATKNGGLTENQILRASRGAPQATGQYLASLPLRLGASAQTSFSTMLSTLAKLLASLPAWRPPTTRLPKVLVLNSATRLAFCPRTKR